MCYLGSTVVHFAVILFYLFYCQGAVTMEGKTKQDSETERYPHLKYMLSEYIKELCENYCLDLKVLKTKEERVKALQTIPNLSDVTSKFSPKMSVNSPIVKFRLEGLHPLGAEDDLECYLSTFERLCNSQEIPSKRWPILLEPYLTGKAQKAFHILSESQKQSYVVVKDALLAAFQLTPDTYREKFRSAVKDPSETFRQYGSRLSLYLRRWTAPTDRLASSPGSSTVVYTDHQALVWMLRAKALKGRLMRWALRLQEFDYIIHYRPGSQNVVPDALSRAVIGVVNYDQNAALAESDECVERSIKSCVLPDENQFLLNQQDDSRLLTIRQGLKQGNVEDVGMHGYVMEEDL
ncbi:hypothetical protein BSL78_28635 [Apostichopus japonicus]|uniref:Reverse transcriptase RNase H-like domain-containing protein n=1 Tax=Stichopus japonicus TaxID=307972 RepID=A0A2G8JFK8_STIJA|nr:hypothetical protein BSL78_28635 [Apostichopus japonicus]